MDFVLIDDVYLMDCIESLLLACVGDLWGESWLDIRAHLSDANISMLFYLESRGE